RPMTPTPARTARTWSGSRSTSPTGSVSICTAAATWNLPRCCTTSARSRSPRRSSTSRASSTRASGRASRPTRARASGCCGGWAGSGGAGGEDAHMITSSEATFRALLSSSIADAGERERLAAELARASEVEVARQKSQLAAALSREIRAPLNSIIATAEQLRRSGLDLAQREHAEALAASAQALLCLVTDLLDLSKAD